ncbi:hypothetical protein BGX28_006103 [Mortierella sp. GBA30]|nr:hypothetical protein BGX28_006103 [Mortierella sp. GBA30]
MGNGSKTPTASSFQERMKERDREKQQREREEHSRLDTAASTTATPAAGSGTTLWSRLRAAKEVIKDTITGEEKWPESDDSDYEGESHVIRILREYADKKEDEEMAAKIAELDMMPISGSGSKATGTNSTSGRNQYLRDAVRKEPATPSIISSTSSNEQDDYYGRSLRSRGEATNARADPSEHSWSPSTPTISTTSSSSSSNSNYGSNNLTVGSAATGNRFRTASDASRDDALSRLEGKNQGDKLAAQVSHLGSTSPRARANSPNPGNRQQDPAPSSSSPYQQSQQAPQSRNQYQQYGNQNQLSPSSAVNNNNHYSPSSSQRSVSPGANRRYDPPSPGGSGRYGGHPHPPASPSYPNNNYRAQASPTSHGDGYGSARGRTGGDASHGYGRSEYERRPTYPPQTGGGGGGGGSSGGYGHPPSGGKNQGAYGQRQQQQQHYQQYQQQYGSSQGNYF